MTTLTEKTTGLLAFVRTVETGSFSKAARVLGATPSAVGKSVSKLEARLGMRLVQRTTRSLSLTNEGAVFYERVSRLVRDIEEAEESVNDTSSPRGQLRVSAPIDLGRLVLAAWMDEFLRRFPALRVELLLTDRNVDLAREGVDVAIRIGPLADSTLITQTIARARFVVCAASSYLNEHGSPADLDELRRHNCLRYLTSGRPYNWLFLDGNGSKAVSVAGNFDTDDGGALIAAACAGAGIAYCFHFQAQPHFATGVLRPVLETFRTPAHSVHALHTHTRHVSPRIRAWIDFLRTRFSSDERFAAAAGESVRRKPDRPRSKGRSAMARDRKAT
jgi:DNA-binding transcriptional LysR family regulator